MANWQLTENNLKQHTTLITNREADKAIKSAISLSNAKRYESLQTQLMKDLPPSISEMIPQACEKGASSWLTGLPYEKHGFVLNKRGFKDAIALRYALPIANIAKNCIYVVKKTPTTTSLSVRRGALLTADTTASEIPLQVYLRRSAMRLL